jgi:hypothetical protein
MRVWRQPAHASEPHGRLPASVHRKWTSSARFLQAFSYALVPTRCRHDFGSWVNLSTKLLILLAGGPGFEPRLTESESAVLPLNYPPTGAWAKRDRFLANRVARRKRFASAMAENGDAAHRSNACPDRIAPTPHMRLSWRLLHCPRFSCSPSHSPVIALLWANYLPVAVLLSSCSTRAGFFEQALGILHLLRRDGVPKPAILPVFSLLAGTA